MNSEKYTSKKAGYSTKSEDSWASQFELIKNKKKH